MKLISIILLCMFAPCLETKNEIDFLILGDWGGESDYPYTTKIETTTAKQMATVAKTTNSSFILALGDNFYESGVKNEYDERFQKTFVNVYNAASLQVPWYIIGGNHDHYGNISAQVAYTQHSQIWKFPDLWHSHKFLIPGTNKTLKIVLLDTIVLCGNSGLDEELFQPQGPAIVKLAEEQWSWLEEQLKNSRDDYVIVGGHFPVWSMAEHGPTKCLVKRLRPMLEKYKVNAYVCGHDHSLQFIREAESNVNYFVVGTADKISNDQSHKHYIPRNAETFFWAEEHRYGGFAHVQITENNMTVNLIDAFGASLFSRQINPRN